VSIFKPKSLIFCLIIISALFTLIALAQTPEEERQALEAELKTLEDKISQYEKEIGDVQGQKKTLQSQITAIQQKIKKLDLQIKQGNLMIKDLNNQITDTENSIIKTTQQIGQTTIKLKSALRTLYQANQKGELEIVLANSTISDFFTDLANLEALNIKISQSLADVKSLKITLQEQRDSLDTEQHNLQKVVNVQTLQKQSSQESQQQQETILEQTKGKETLYQQYLTETKKKAAQIRSRIFELIGVPEAPTFGQAYEIAKIVYKTTGVRPAFLLAVLTQESNIGKNVGQCYLSNTNTGAGIRISNGKVEAKLMSPSNVPLFLQIVKDLGRDPYHTPVSCPIASVGGYGGAMGPAQFIPSTWMAYKDKVQANTGKAADPWSITDAFLAAGLYLKDLGASSSEWRAAMKYFSGSTWTKYEEFYGNNVIAIAADYEDDIKALENGLSKATLF
jgi:membrane-bound lytic murein transglycosylase B